MSAVRCRPKILTLVLLSVTVAVVLPAGAGASSPAGPVTSLHYSPNGNFGKGRRSDIFLPGKDGFNLADVGSVDQLRSLSSNVLGLVYLGLCKGADSSFISAVKPFVGQPKVYGFYLMDEPDPTGQYAPLCPAANLKEESDWIHANDPTTKTFIVLMNLGTPTSPSFTGAYMSANTDIDLFGLDPYPCRPEFGGCDYAVITDGVSTAEAAGFAEDQIVPVYQAFGGGGYRSWKLPTAAQEQTILATWGILIPNPAFDYAYSWGRQERDRSLQHSNALRAVFATHNG